jgi:pimeloyl-ACP methyl ester carboxylesterase
MTNDLLSREFFTNRDGLKLFYRRNFIDNKPSKIILFNNGLVCSEQHFILLSEQLGQRGFGVILHDYRGHFNSEGKAALSQITFDHIVNDVTDLLDHLEIEYCHSVIGHSMGVNICLELVERFPERFKNTILISGTALPVKDIMFGTNIMEIMSPYLLLALEAYPDIFNLLWSSSKYNWPVKKIVQYSGFNPGQVDFSYVDQYVNKLTLLGPEIFFQLFEQLSQHDILSRLHSVKTPALIIGGDKDKVIPWYLQTLLKTQLVNSQLYMLKNGSHVPQIDFPELTLERILSFWD